MATRGMDSVFQHLRRLALLQAGTGITDGQLLESFVANKDSAAFEALVRRHGRMVQGVCLRVLRNQHDAEDAFQATFLVLAHKAARVIPREMVGNWLYGVAHTTALRARAKAAQRLRRERQVANMRETNDAGAGQWDDLQVVLDEELTKLPDKYRLPIVLCDLEGRSRREVARQLKIPEGTLSSRLTTARRTLAKRLSRRGLALSIASMAALLSQNASSAYVAPALVAGTVKAAALLATGQAMATGVVSISVIALKEGVLKAMLISKLKAAVSLLVMVAAVGLGGGLAAQRTGLAEEPQRLGERSKTADEGKPASAPAQAEMPKPEGSGHILYGCDGKLYLMDPDGKNERHIDLPPMGGRFPMPCLSPDGQSLAFWTLGANDDTVVSVRTLDGKGFGTKFELKEAAGFVTMFWSPSGQELHVNLGGPEPEIRHFRLDVKSGKVTRLSVLKPYLLADQTRDGKLFLAISYGSQAAWRPKSIHLVTPAGTGEKLLAKTEKGWTSSARLAPDGRRALVIVEDKPYVIDIDKPGMLKPVAGIPKNAEVNGCAWAPDGKHIVYVIGTVHFLDPEALKKFETRLVVADPDGGNAKVVRLEKGKVFLGVDWQTGSAEEPHRLIEKSKTAEEVKPPPVDPLDREVQGSTYARALRIPARNLTLEEAVAIAQHMAGAAPQSNADNPIQRRAEFKRQMHNLRLNVEVAYWHLYEAYGALHANEEVLRGLHKVWMDNFHKDQAGKVDSSILAQVRGQYEEFRGERTNSLVTVLEAERNLRGIMGMPVEDGKRLVPVTAPSLAHVELKWEDALKDALQKRPEMALARENLRLKELAYAREKNSPDSTPASLIDHRLQLAQASDVLKDQEERVKRTLTHQYQSVSKWFQLIENRRAERGAYAKALTKKFDGVQMGKKSVDLDLLDVLRRLALAATKECQAIAEYNNSLARLEFARGTIMRDDDPIFTKNADIRTIGYEEQANKTPLLPRAPVAVNAVHLKTAQFEANCKSLTSAGSPERIILVGDVHLVCNKNGQVIRVEGQRVVLNLGDGTYAVE